MSDPKNSSSAKAYWNASLLITQGLLIVWAILSLGCGVLFRKTLDANLPAIGGAPFGFWMAQQGAIIGFVVLLIIYMVAMNRLDAAHGFEQQEDQEEQS
ncbi:MAG: DUF4212 domain-containing protein [Planctomycetota bacterium]